ncbi:hypothetical protein L209DRAFT_753482 [Thermothelomyces heterothallicus CBS 203.75]
MVGEGSRRNHRRNLANLARCSVMRLQKSCAGRHFVRWRLPSQREHSLSGCADALLALVVFCGECEGDWQVQTPATIGTGRAGASLSSSIWKHCAPTLQSRLQVLPKFGQQIQ